jgi:tetratricopeptide (TPR) repeat protein
VNRGPLTAFEGAIDDCDKAWVYYERGFSRESLGDLEKAIADYTQAIELAPSSGRFCLYRGLTYDRQGNLEAAFADYDKTVELDPTNPTIYYIRGSRYEENGYIEETIADFERSLQLSDDPDFLAIVADMLEELRQSP